MTKFFTIPAIALTLSLGAAADASAWERKGSITGWRGTSTVEGSGSCSGGSCSRAVTKTGPNGYSVSRQGNGSCSGGTCSGSRTTTNRLGNSITRQGSISR
ncbi:MAG: hypothetical protein AAFU72_07300 [Pseudomonadota bacterium]